MPLFMFLSSSLNVAGAQSDTGLLRILGLWPHAVSPDGPCTLPSAGSSAQGPSDATEPEGVHSWPWQWGCPSTLHVGEDLTEGEKEASHDQKSVCVCVCAHTRTCTGSRARISPGVTVCL